MLNFSCWFRKVKFPAQISLKKCYALNALAGAAASAPISKHQQKITLRVSSMCRNLKQSPILPFPAIPSTCSDFVAMWTGQHWTLAFLQVHGESNTDVYLRWLTWIRWILTKCLCWADRPLRSALHLSSALDNRPTGWEVWGGTEGGRVVGGVWTAGTVSWRGTTGPWAGHRYWHSEGFSESGDSYMVGQRLSGWKK